MARIAIVGGHGKVALLLSPILVGEGHRVTSMFRNPEQGEDVRATGATPVVLDVEHSSTRGDRRADRGPRRDPLVRRGGGR